MGRNKQLKQNNNLNEGKKEKDSNQSGHGSTSKCRTCGLVWSKGVQTKVGG